MAEQVLDLRRIGCSDLATVLGRNRYAEPVDLWARIVHGIDIERSAVLEEMGDMGKALEEVVAREGLRRKLDSNAPLYRPPSITPRARPWQRYSIDWLAGIIEHPFDEGVIVQLHGQGPRIVETKVRSYWQIHGTEAGWGKDGSADVAEDVLIQVQGQLEAVRADRDSWLGTDVPDVDVVDVLVLVDGQRLRHYPVPYDAELAGMVREECERFWVDHVLTQTPPPLLFGEGTLRELRRRHPRLDGELRADKAVEAIARELIDLTDARKQLGERIDVLDAQLAAAAAGARRIAGEGWSWSQWDQDGRVRFTAVIDELAKLAGVTEAQLDEIKNRHRGPADRQSRLTTKKTKETTTR